MSGDWLKRTARLLLAALAILGARLPAQSPADRTMLAAWDDSLLAATSSATLQRFPQRGAVETEATPLRRLLFRVRNAQLRHDLGDMERALGGLMLEAGQHPSWPWPSLALARAFEWMHRQRLMAGGWSGVLDGESLASASWRQIARMMVIDPAFDTGREYFFTKLVAAGERELHEDQLVPMMAELRRPAPDPRALLAWGRVVRAQELYDSAMKVLDRAARGGEDVSQIALERARTFRALGDTTAARAAYWEGLTRLTPAGRAAYRYDLQWIINADSIAAFDRIPNDRLAAWMRRFWDERDAAVANRFGERLQEHLARWVVAVAAFRVTTPWRRTDLKRVDAAWDGLRLCVANDSTFYDRLWGLQPTYPGDLRDRERLFDHRGLIYLRHGAPLSVVGNPDQQVPAIRGLSAGANITDATPSSGPLGPVSQQMRRSASWLYWFNGRYRVLSFRGSAALGLQAPTTLSSYLPFGNPAWYRDLAGLPVAAYAQAANQLQRDMLSSAPMATQGCSEAVLNAVGQAREDGHSAIDSDTDMPRLLDVWDGVFSAYGLGHGTDRNGEALLSFALPGKKLQSETDAQGRPIWPIHFRVVAYEARTGRRVEHEMVHRFADPPSLATRGFLTGWLELPLDPGEWRIAIRANQGNDSAGFFGLERNVVISGESNLALSDLVRGIDGARLWTATDGRGFPLNALATWTPAMPMALYYEVRGVPAGQSYRNAIRIHEADSAEKKLLDIGTTEYSAGLVTPVRKVLDLERLKPGRYLLVVTITAGKNSVERRMAFDVLRP